MPTDITRCNDCACSSMAIKEYGGCPRAFAPTVPADQADGVPEREKRSIPGTGLVIALAVAFGGICLGFTLALAFSGWR